MEKKRQRLQRTGYVVSDKMDKTVVVRIERTTKHPLYKKVIKKFRKIKAHDEKNAAKMGDKVIVKQVKPLSKDKRWSVVKILEHQLTKQEQAEKLEQVNQ